MQTKKRKPGTFVAKNEEYKQSNGNIANQELTNEQWGTTAKTDNGNNNNRQNPGSKHDMSGRGMAGEQNCMIYKHKLDGVYVPQSLPQQPAVVELWWMHKTMSTKNKTCPCQKISPKELTNVWLETCSIVLNIIIHGKAELIWLYTRQRNVTDQGRWYN